jgi:hypothetical protein
MAKLKEKYLNNTEYDPTEYYPEDNHAIECPECGEPMEEIWQVFYDNEENDAEGLVGYECKCGIKYNPHGEEVS